MRVNVELARTTEETGHVEPGPTLPLELDILLNSSVMFESILQRKFLCKANPSNLAATFTRRLDETCRQLNETCCKGLV